VCRGFASNAGRDRQEFPDFKLRAYLDRSLTGVFPPSRGCLSLPYFSRHPELARDKKLFFPGEMAFFLNLMNFYGPSRALKVNRPPLQILDRRFSPPL